jgi:DNA polymerase-3 subunit epsilon
MSSGLILVHDWETTGLTLHPDADVRKQPRAIEFGGALLSRETGEVVETLSLLINPGQALEAVITKITGLTDADLADAPSFVDALPQLQHIFRQATAVVAHNLPFDRQILRGELARANLTEFPWPARELCTVGEFTPLWGRMPKLTEVYEWAMERPLPQTHRALDDVLALVEIIQRQQIWRHL